MLLYSRNLFVNCIAYREMRVHRQVVTQRVHANRSGMTDTR